MNILTFIAENPWLTFFLGPFVFVSGCVVAVFLYGAMVIVFRLVNRLLRTIKVCVRGWPPEHVDADGDFKQMEVADPTRKVNETRLQIPDTPRPSLAE